MQLRITTHRGVVQAGRRTFVADEELAVDVQQRTIVAVDEEGVVGGVTSRKKDVACMSDVKARRPNPWPNPWHVCRCTLTCAPKIYAERIPAWVYTDEICPSTRQARYLGLAADWGAAKADAQSAGPLTARRPGARGDANVRYGTVPGRKRTGEAQAEICGRVVGEAEQVAAEHVRIVDVRRDGREVGLQRCRDGQGCHLLRVLTLDRNQDVKYAAESQEEELKTGALCQS